MNCSNSTQLSINNATSQNGSQTFCGHHKAETTPAAAQMASWMAVILLLCIIGTVSNLMVIIVVLRIRELRTSCGFLIAHLSVTYLLQCAIIVPLTSVRIYNRFDGGPEFCRIIQFINSALVITSYYNEGLLGVNRLVAICFPHSYRVFALNSVTFGGLFLCWILGAGTRLPFVFGYGGFYLSLPNGQCSLKTTTSAAAFMATGGMYISYGLVGFSAVVICVKSTLLKYQQRTVPLPPSSVRKSAGVERDVQTMASLVQTRRTYKRRLRRAQMLIVTFIWSCICNFPISIVNAALPQLFRIDPMSGLWMRLLLVVAFAFHPILVFLMSTDYRKGIARMWSH